MWGLGEPVYPEISRVLLPTSACETLFSSQLKRTTHTFLFNTLYKLVPVISILETRKLSIRECKQFALGQMAGKQQCLELNQQ